MKKSNLFFMLLTALIVMSCSKDETTMSIPQESNAIEFGTYLGRNPQTRGAELTTTNITNFGIMASYTGTGVFVPASSPINFMHNQLVEGSSTTSWSYTPVKYWPTTIGDKISFFAYAPHSSDDSNVQAGTEETSKILTVSSKGTLGTPTVTYTVPTDPTKMVDFVAGVVMNRARIITGTGTVADKVDFSLKHELTRVAFQAKVNKEVYGSTAADKTKINIKSATFDEGAKFYSKGVYTFATVNDQRGTWAPSDATAFPITNAILNVATPVATELGGYVQPGILLDGTTSVSLFKEVSSAPSYLFLIPPNGTDGLVATDYEVSVTFEYDIVTVDTNLAIGHSVTSAKKTVKLPVGTLKQGVAYNFTFEFKVDEVVVTATVDTWDTTGTGTGTVDYGTPDVTP